MIIFRGSERNKDLRSALADAEADVHWKGLLRPQDVALRSASTTIRSALMRA